MVSLHSSRVCSNIAFCFLYTDKMKPHAFPAFSVRGGRGTFCAFKRWCGLKANTRVVSDRLVFLCLRLEHDAVGAVVNQHRFTESQN